MKRKRYKTAVKRSKLSKGIVSKILLHFFLVFASLGVAVVFLTSNQIHSFLENTQDFVIISSFISGLFFTSTFSVAPATVSLFLLGEKHNPILISAFAAAGSVVGDLIISKIVRKEVSNNIYGDILPKQNRLRRIIRKILHTKVVYWSIATLALIIIASPFPDELGISLLSLIHFKIHHFVVMSYVVNFVGILVITGIARIG
ncbi:hypothetical protein A2773_02040 [Candidatus Gottesmanbacteria bacterium RIFCSPHIGHO2_01_FULL_39_10]|uniref:TVP38/TMEM64 family membrane protein n=1 Tax=Candidatus Gottesmanbacteria bacterium RIFCSPHIGHO2_01_FULL_39_10 TaxID=1798375 RepID=A0A1F5ZRH7_9BACT|nr:MAG: hypothetical protein A2773_02040 [Candidatus Gottesmanbacteria bacterium RIFCSPHIGHO2_01_FULL_39_10]